MMGGLIGPTTRLCEPRTMMNFWPTKLFIVIAACAGVAYGVPVESPTPTNYLAGRKFSLKTTRVQRIKFCKLPGAVLIRHLPLIWRKFQENRRTTVSSELSAMTTRSESLSKTMPARIKCAASPCVRKYSSGDALPVVGLAMPPLAFDLNEHQTRQGFRSAVS